MQATRLDPDRAGLALAGRAAPLARAARDVGPGKGPLAVVAGRRLVLAVLDALGLHERDDRPDVPALDLAVDDLSVIALVQHGDVDLEAAPADLIKQAGNFCLL